ncbi:hypothetical protein GCM10010193_69590 [Kitasatospora atroaurantiaca]|uniref:Helix-turn-helix protein n=1 Tax=Kitasatospora atroaurantiaca TaxID=285545 RepID=A0A561EN58_9ACTN|nr:helix-turn-helix transcriptional regulator [Kitasatospora atroaurantiaca]TWE17044.1 helix-turn-helix protein [Kitasatospora atroaurantiaca]
MSTHQVNCTELHRRLDEHRKERGLSWNRVGRETGLSPSTFNRLKNGGSPDAHAFLSLLVWLGAAEPLQSLIEATGPVTA